MLKLANKTRDNIVILIAMENIIVAYSYLQMKRPYH